MKCPTCQVALTMTDRNGIEIDYCPQCRGIWLDRGELDKIIDRSAAPAAPQAGSPFSSEHRYTSDQDRYYADKDRYYKKKKGFLGDLFDF